MRCLLLLLALFGCLAVHAQNLLPNPSFDEGADQPASWTLSAGAGKWDAPGHTGPHCLAITGDGKGSNYWSAPLPELPALGVYRMSFWARSLPGASGGCFVTGPNFCNRDYSFSDQWRRYSSVLCAPAKTTGAICRFGQWTVTGTGQYDDGELRPVMPVHTDTSDGITLGEGEEINGTVYAFHTNYAGPGSNYCRALVSATASFNSSRWCFGPGTELIYKLQAGNLGQTAARIGVNVGWYASGTCLVEAAREPGQWQPVGQLDGGHIAYAILGEKSKKLAIGCFIALIILGLTGWSGWFVWAGLLYVMGWQHPPPLNPAVPLDTKRKWLGVLALILFVVTFTPTPFSGF